MSAKTSLLPRTWIEIDAAAARHNARVFRRLIGPKVFLWGVVKSNAYGHGLFAFTQAIRNSVDGFCVDSLIEGVRLREAGFQNQILVIGPTLPELFPEAAKWSIAVSISGDHDLKKILSAKICPDFHIKIDSGFHRRGFYIASARRVAGQVRRSRNAAKLRGLFTHFSTAKDIYYPAHAEHQIRDFKRAAEEFKKAGFRGLMLHAAASGGALMSKAFHLDAVRIGMGLYGYAPSSELGAELPDLGLRPVLAWKAVITEVKKAKKGAHVGYDRTERLSRDSRLAIVPVGYWHGFSRALSGPTGELLVHGQRVRVLGRVSMDILIVDVTGTKAKAGDTVTLIGRSGRESVLAPELAAKSGTTHYEFLTRLNPLIERRLK